MPNADGTKFYLIVLDLKVNAFEDFNEATRFGSRSVIAWESDDLATWSEVRLPTPLVDESAGNAWAPEAEYDLLVGAHVVVFASRFWDPADVDRRGRKHVATRHAQIILTGDSSTSQQAHVCHHTRLHHIQ